MKRIYVAASYDQRFKLRAVRQEFAVLGVELTSRWIDYDFEPEDAPRHRGHYAMTDIHDIERADALVLLVDVPSTSGGMWTEFGYALGKEIPTIVVGLRHMNPFTALAHAEATHIEMVPSLLDELTN